MKVGRCKMKVGRQKKKPPAHLNLGPNQGSYGRCQESAVSSQQDEWKACRARAGHFSLMIKNLFADSPILLGIYCKKYFKIVNIFCTIFFQIILTKPSAAAAGGSFLDIMRHPTLRIHTLIMWAIFPFIFPLSFSSPLYFMRHPTLEEPSASTVWIPHTHHVIA